MPYNKYNNANADKLHEDIEFVGIARATWIDSDESSRKIAGILIDTRFLIENWIKRCDKSFNDLMNLIETKVGASE